jgi:type IV pilus assembly protein PilN
VILINLLPHREARRQERKRAFFSALGLAAIVGIGLIVLWFGVLQQLTSAQEARNKYLSDEVKRLEEQIKDIAALRSEIDALKARQKAVEDLQTDRNVPVYLLDELVKQTPEGIYLTAVKQNANVVTVSGLSQTNERVSEMLRNTAYNSPWLERPELVEIKATNVGTGRELRRLFDFSMRVSIKRPQSAATAASGATGAAAPAKPDKPARPASAPKPGKVS